MTDRRPFAKNSDESATGFYSSEESISFFPLLRDLDNDNSELREKCDNTIRYLTGCLLKNGLLSS